MNKVAIKPLSVNEAFQGRRYKTKAYKTYEKTLLSILPDVEIPDDNLILHVKVGYSNKRSDIDNFLKPFIDVLQKKYGFDDAMIYGLVVNKEITKKGFEYICFKISRTFSCSDFIRC